MKHILFIIVVSFLLASCQPNSTEIYGTTNGLTTWYFSFEGPTDRARGEYFVIRPLGANKSVTSQYEVIGEGQPVRDLILSQNGLKCATWTVVAFSEKSLLISLSGSGEQAGSNVMRFGRTTPDTIDAFVK